VAKSYEVLVHVAAGDLVEARCWRAVSAAGKLPPPSNCSAQVARKMRLLLFTCRGGGAVFLDKHLSLALLVHILLFSVGMHGSP
jgi:hypothetical protein